MGVVWCVPQYKLVGYVYVCMYWYVLIAAIQVCV